MSTEHDSQQTSASEAQRTAVIDGPPTKWWIAIDGNPEGPHSTAYVVALVREGRIKPSSLACEVGKSKWMTVANYEELAGLPTNECPESLPPRLPDSSPHIQKATRILEYFTNPELPWFANWICVYCVLVSPTLFVLDTLFTLFGTNLASELRSASPLIGYGVGIEFTTFVVEVTLATMLAAGGISLRKLQRTGAKLIKLTLILGLCWSVVDLLVWIVWQALVTLGEQVEPVADPSARDLLLLLALMLPLFLIGVSLLAFEITALVWLWRKGESFPELELARESHQNTNDEPVQHPSPINATLP